MITYYYWSPTHFFYVLYLTNNFQQESISLQHLPNTCAIEKEKFVLNILSTWPRYSYLIIVTAQETDSDNFLDTLPRPLILAKPCSPLLPITIRSTLLLLE